MDKFRDERKYVVKTNSSLLTMDLGSELVKLMQGAVGAPVFPSCGCVAPSWGWGGGGDGGGGFLGVGSCKCCLEGGHDLCHLGRGGKDLDEYMARSSVTSLSMSLTAAPILEILYYSAEDSKKTVDTICRHEMFSYCY